MTKADEWDEIFRVHLWGKYPPEELIRFIMRAYPENRGEISVLEIGCGPGANLWFLAREGFKVFGIDISPVAINQARLRLVRDGLSIPLIIGDITNLSCIDNQFDCVIDIECLYANDITDTKKAIREVYRVLVPGGRFFSKTFMTGTNKSIQYNSEIMRLTALEEIPDLYAPFTIEGIDSVMRTDRDGHVLIKEWLISCRKEV